MESSSRFKYIQCITCCRSIHFIKNCPCSLAFSCHLTESRNSPLAHCIAELPSVLRMSEPLLGNSPAYAAPGCPFLFSSYWLSPSFPWLGMFPYFAPLHWASNQLIFILWYITNSWFFFSWLFLRPQQHEGNGMKRIKDFLKKKGGNTECKHWSLSYLGDVILSGLWV